MKWKKLLHWKALLVSVLLTTIVSCTKVNFSLIPHLLQTYSILTARFDFTTSFNQGKVWVVTPPPTQTVNEISIDDVNKKYPVKTWSYSLNPGSVGGSRTFVTSIGLVFARLPAQLFLVNDGTPTTSVLTPVWSGSNPSPAGRACATSYKANNSSYVGVAWTDINNNRVFTQIPINTSSNSLDVANKKDVVLGPGPDPGGIGWAYSCFTDQGHNIFWTAPAYQSSVFGVNLDKLTDVSPSLAPNARHPLIGDASLSKYFGEPVSGNGGYALSGDGFGNVLVGSYPANFMYTFTHETSNNITYASTGGVGSLFAYPSLCSSGQIDCSGKVVSFSTSGIGSNPIGTGALGPMSSLNDGRTAAISRGSATTNSIVYLLSPVSATDLTKGLAATNIGSIPGDAYMYTDFTGATLYPQPIDQTYDLTSFTGYKASLPLQNPTFVWLGLNGSGEIWTGLTVRARCFNASNQGTVQLSTVDTVNPSGQITLLSGVPSCANGSGFDRVEISVASSGPSIFSRASQIIISAQQ